MLRNPLPDPSNGITCLQFEVGALKTEKKLAKFKSWSWYKDNRVIMI